MERLKRFIIAVAMAGAMISPTGASAGHCNDIYFYSGRVIAERGTGVYFSLLTCPEHIVDTDVIVPGSEYFSIRWNRGDQPAGLTMVEGKPTGTYVSYAGSIFPIKFSRPSGENHWSSERIFIDPLTTLVENIAEIHVCTFDLEECQVRAFRTIAS